METKEHILVCLSSSPSNPKVIKSARKMAEAFNARFTALYIETTTNINNDDKTRINKHKRLAKSFGAEIISISGDDIPYQVAKYAKTSTVTKIILGRSGFKSNSLFIMPDFTDKLLELVPEIELYIIPDKVQELYTNIKKAKDDTTPKDSIKTYSLEVMLDMSRHLLKCSDKNEITKVTKLQIEKLLNCNVQILTDFTHCKIDNNKCFAIKNNSKIYAVALLEEPVRNEFEKDMLFAMLRETVLAYENEEISDSKNKLIIRNKQEELRSALLRTISHDLRTPLCGISGNAELLIKNSNLLSEEKQIEILKYIQTDSLWLNNIVENILSITRFEGEEIKLNKKSENIADVITQAVSHTDINRENYQLTIDTQDYLYATIDVKLIEQVIVNLVNNAMRYSAYNTKIHIKAAKEKGDIIVSVKDEGIGIKQEDKAKIFEMFYIAENSVIDGKRSMGLGLALCKAVIKAHGGKIEVKDNSPKGTIFSFRIKGDNDE